MTQKSQIVELQKKVAQLEYENLQLQKERPRTIEHFVEVPPPDYRELENRCRTAAEEVQGLQNRCRIMERVLCYSEISPMSQIIREYQSMSTFYLQQLTKEIEIYRASAKERSELLDFLNYLRAVTHDVEEMLLIQD